MFASQCVDETTCRRTREQEKQGTHRFLHLKTFPTFSPSYPDNTEALQVVAGEGDVQVSRLSNPLADSPPSTHYCHLSHMDWLP